MTTFDHFAYGSNLSSKRLRARCESAVVMETGFVTGRQLRFHKSAKDGTAKADAFWTGNADDIVWGVIYRCHSNDRAELDRCETLGVGYRFVPIDVHVGERIIATHLYEAMPSQIDPTLHPLSWYTDHVLTGAAEHQLPNEYQIHLTKLIEQANA